MTIYQIDDSRPFITSGGIPVQWHTGAAAAKIISSSILRIHPRGLYFKQRTWHIRDLQSAGWSSVPCFPSAHGLCELRDGSVLFPSTDPPFVNENLVWKCGSQATSRIITNQTGRYDASACDVLDAGVDYVFSDGIIYSLQTGLAQWTYWAICLLVIYLVRCLSKYVLASLTKKDKQEDNKAKKSDILPNPITCLLASAATTLLVVGQGDHVFTTHEDLIFYWFTVFYIGAYECLFLCTRFLAYVKHTEKRDPPFYNLLAGVLQLVASRLYVGAETPYNPPIIFIIAVRMVVKSHRKPDLLRCITLLLDSLMLSLTCVYGFGPATHYLAAVFVAAVAWADFLM